MYEHLIKTVFEIDKSEIKVIVALRYKKITKLMNLDQYYYSQNIIIPLLASTTTYYNIMLSISGY